MRIAAGPAVLIVGAVAGYLTAIQTISRAGKMPMAESAQWSRSGADPKNRYAFYAYAHFLQDGVLPPPSSAEVYVRNRDDDGNSLRGTCTYQFLGAAPNARWWSINLENSSGNKIKSFTSADAVLTGDSKLQLGLSRRAMPGNWLSTEGIGDMRIALVIHERYALGKAEALADLPRVQKLGCE